MGKVVELRQDKVPLTRSEELSAAASLRVRAARMAQAAAAMHVRAGELEARRANKQG